MDRIVAVIVRLYAFLGRFARLIPSLRYERFEPGSPLKLLLVGYNGARNTGSDVRVAAMISQLNETFGADNITMSLMSLDPESSKPYLAENVDIIEFDTIFFGALLKAISSHHAIVLCEGSMLKSKFANGLTLFLCQAAGTAKAQNKPCIAYGVEAGAMDGYVEKTARKMCSDVHFIARTEESAQIIRDLGLTANVGTDSAWTFSSASARDEAIKLLKTQGWNGTQPLLGTAVINPFCWPAKPSIGKTIISAIKGKWEYHYQKWYFFSWSSERERHFKIYVDNLAASVNDYCSRHDCMPVIIGMEKLDIHACKLLASRLEKPYALVLSNNLNGYVISEVLEKLDVLITSRYHAALLSMARNVVPIAVSMDERLANLFNEAQQPEATLLSASDQHLADQLNKALELERHYRGEMKARLKQYRDTRRVACMEMAQLATDYIKLELNA